MSKWTTSIDELIRLFGDAIRVLVPIAERAHMAWKEPDAYDDWDQICEAIYRSIVIGSIEFAEGIGTFLPVPDYDRRIKSYDKNSFIGDANSKDEVAFVCFETRTAPFDMCLFAILDRNLDVINYSRVAIVDVKFNLMRRDRNGGALEFIDGLTVSL